VEELESVEINKNELVKNKHFKNKYCIIYLHSMKLYYKNKLYASQFKLDSIALYTTLCIPKPNYAQSERRQTLKTE
jgi:hypothetical protein